MPRTGAPGLLAALGGSSVINTRTPAWNMAYSEKHHRKGQCGGRPVPTPGGWREPQGWRVSSLSPEQGGHVFPSQRSELRGRLAGPGLTQLAPGLGTALWRPAYHRGAEGRAQARGPLRTPSTQEGGTWPPCLGERPQLHFILTRPGSGQCVLMADTTLPSRHSILAEARHGAQKRKEQRGFLEAEPGGKSAPGVTHG